MPPLSINLMRPVILANKRVVFAAANIQAGLYPRAPLPHDDRAAGDELSAERLEPKSLRIGIAPVS